jgi:hypothetical protein
VVSGAAIVDRADMFASGLTEQHSEATHPGVFGDELDNERVERGLQGR